jgi:hypothetical protein
MGQRTILGPIIMFDKNPSASLKNSNQPITDTSINDSKLRITKNFS